LTGKGVRLLLTVTIAGLAPESVRIVAPHVRTILSGFAAQQVGDVWVAGIRYGDGESLPVALDNDHGREVFFGVDFYSVIGHYI